MTTAARPMSRTAIGPLLRDWRTRRRRSQLDLAVEVGMSTRHLSFVETGRARPSPELLMTIAEHLDVPLRERNGLLLAAGYAPRYSQHSLDEPELRVVKASLQRMLDAHDPVPGRGHRPVVERRRGQRRGGSAHAGMPDHLLGPPLNVYRACLHPDGLAARTRNFDEWGRYLLGQLRRTLATTADPGLAALLDEVGAYPNVAALAARAEPPSEVPELLVPVVLDDGTGGSLSLFTTLTTFGTPRDVTLDELAVELFFPADDETAAALRARVPS